MKIRIPLLYVKPVCIVSVLIGIVALVSGKWITGLCLLLGSYFFEKNLYRCPTCKKSLDMKAPLFRGACCPACGRMLREKR